MNDNDEKIITFNAGALKKKATAVGTGLLDRARSAVGAATDKVTGRVGEVKSRAKNNVLDRGIRLAEKQKEALSELKD